MVLTRGFANYYRVIAVSLFRIFRSTICSHKLSNDLALHYSCLRAIKEQEIKGAAKEDIVSVN